MGPSIIAARKITIGNDASFNNNVRYWNDKGSVDFRQSIKNGKAIYDPSLKIETGRWYYLGGLSVLGLLWYIGIIGVPVGLLLLFNYIILILLATVITSLVAAHWINNRFHYQWGFWKLVFAALGIFMVLKLISLMPFLGWFIVLLAICMAFGALLQNINWKRKQHVAVTA